MKPYFAYSADELATDDLFVRWVQHPADDEVAVFWQQYISQHTVERSTFEMARTLVNTLSEPATVSLSALESRVLWERIWHSARYDSTHRPTDS